MVKYLAPFLCYWSLEFCPSYECNFTAGHQHASLILRSVLLMSVCFTGAGSAWVLLCPSPQQKLAASAPAASAPAAPAPAAVTSWVETRAQVAERGGASLALRVPLCRSPPLTQDQTPPLPVLQILFWACDGVHLWWEVALTENAPVYHNSEQEEER